MLTNPKTYADFLMLSEGPDPARDVSKLLAPLEDNDILGLTDKDGVTWIVAMYKDGTRFKVRYRS